MYDILSTFNTSEKSVYKKLYNITKQEKKISKDIEEKFSIKLILKLLFKMGTLTFLKSVHEFQAFKYF